MECRWSCEEAAVELLDPGAAGATVEGGDDKDMVVYKDWSSRVLLLVSKHGVSLMLIVLI